MSYFHEEKNEKWSVMCKTFFLKSNLCSEARCALSPRRKYSRRRNNNREDSSWPSQVHRKFFKTIGALTTVFSLLATLDATKKVALWTKRIEVVGMFERMFPCFNRHFDENLKDEKNLKAFWKARS